ncbi:MAG TPA: hypothetical protein PKA28_09925 [Methylomusa anaerophila]|uniref:hypothetical protein n=1 Tax=Methylomusa anaerophila TaxID=1930071 RepID=UPI001315870D|nr:hypothetical protein [Methylomusa anaerophila]HML88757.1 hypothetical protein [Methylomusa anaerophila]
MSKGWGPEEMMLKTVYGPPPKDEERIEDCEFTKKVLYKRKRLRKKYLTNSSRKMALVIQKLPDNL